MTIQFPHISKTKQLHHLNILTGHQAVTRRSDVTDEVISMLLPLASCDGGVVPRVGWKVEICRPRLSLNGADAQWAAGGSSSAKDGAAFFTVSGDTVAGKDVPLVHCVACWRQELAKEGWRAIIDCSKKVNMPIGPKVRRPHRLPWLAVVFNPSMLTAQPLEIFALGDFERCLAWTLIEIGAGG